MSYYNTQLYSQPVRANIKHIPIKGLSQISQILLEEEQSALDIHYSQIYDEDPLKRQSMLKYSESSACKDLDDFEEEIPINQCHLKPKAHTLSKEKYERKENLILPEIEMLMRTKNFTSENSIEEESVRTATSPVFQTSKIGAIGRNDVYCGEKIDLNAELMQIQMNSMRKRQGDESENYGENKPIMHNLHTGNISESLSLFQSSNMAIGRNLIYDGEKIDINAELAQIQMNSMRKREENEAEKYGENKPLMNNFHAENILNSSSGFHSSKVGVFGRNDVYYGEKNDINAELMQIQTSKIGKINQNDVYCGEKIDLNAELTENEAENKLITTTIHAENISDKIEMTNRSSYKSLSQVELTSKNAEDIFRNNIANFSIFFSQREKNNWNGTKNSNDENENKSYSVNKTQEKVNFMENFEIKTKIQEKENITEENEQKNKENEEKTKEKSLQKEKSYGFNELEIKLNKINEEIALKMNEESSKQGKKNENHIYFDQKLKRITELNEDFNEMKTSMNLYDRENLIPADEIFEKPVNLDHFDHQFQPLNHQIQMNSNEIRQKLICEEQNLKNLNFFLAVEKTIKEDSNKFRNENIFKNEEKCYINNEILVRNDEHNPEKLKTNKKIQINIDFPPLFLENQQEKDPELKFLRTEPKENITKKTDFPKNEVSNFNFISTSKNLNDFKDNNKSNHMNKIADSFKEIAATITETINKHKIEIEKDCDLSVYKNFLTKVREQSIERLSKKYNLTEPDEKFHGVSNNHSDSQILKYCCLSPNISSFPKEPPINFSSYKIEKNNKSKQNKKINILKKLL